jgi:hypothetical protein
MGNTFIFSKIQNCRELAKRNCPKTNKLCKNYDFLFKNFFCAGGGGGG